jgi:fibronectin-binding autotransporter adhesin
MKPLSPARFTLSNPPPAFDQLRRFLFVTWLVLALLALVRPASAANPTYQAAVLANNPYFYYELGEAPGNTAAYDASVNNFTAAYVNGPNALPGGPTLGVPGDNAGGTSDTAATFSAAGLTYVEVPQAAEAFGTLSVQSSYEFIYKTTDKTDAISLSSEENSGSSEAVTMVINQNSPQSPSISANNIRFFVRTLTAGNSVTISISNNVVTDGNYHHLVFTYNGTNTGNNTVSSGTLHWTTNLTSAIYLDGVLQTNGFEIQYGGVQPPQGYGPFGVPIVIGTETAHSATALADYFNGAIDEVAYYTNVLSGAQILANYNALIGSITNDAWTGAVNTNWDTATANWTNSTPTNVFSDGVLAAYNGDPVTFGDSAANFTVNLAANVTPLTVTFNNSAHNYTVASAGGFGIGGVAALTTLGSGTVTLLDTNTFTGPITISAGELALGGSGQLGAGTYAGNIADNGAFVDASTSPQTLAGPISGTGSLTVNAPGAALTLANANTFTGPTLVAAGTLFLSGAGSLSNSPSITLSPNAVFNVSGAAAGVLGANQNLLGGGAVNGSLATTANSKIIPGTDGTVGTLTFGNSLTLDGSSKVNFDVSASHASGNDKIVVAGTLNLNGNSFHLKAPSTAASLDTSADYVLITATGGISGSFFGTPIFDVAPANAGHYSIVTSGNTVSLHYNAIAGPTVTGIVTPTSVNRNGTVAVSVTVTPGGSPSITGVTVSSSAINGGTLYNLSLSATPNVWTNTLTIPPGTLPGNENLQATATDGNGLQGFASLLLTVNASTETWSGLGAGQNWDSNADWVSGLAPGYVGDSLVFTGTVGLSPVLDQDYTVPALTFSSTAGAFTLTNTPGNLLTLASGSTVVNNSTHVETLNLPVNLSGPATLESSGNLVLNGPVGEVTTGAGVLTIQSGTTILQNSNTYSGNTIINNGTLTIGPGGDLGDTGPGGGGGNYTGNIVNSGTFNYFSGVPQTFSGVIAGPGAININGGGTANGPIVTLNALNTYTGNVTITNTYVSDIQADAVTTPNVSGVGNPQNLNQTFTINSNAVMSFDVAAPMGNGSATVLGWILNRGGVLQNTASGTVGIGPVTFDGGTLVPQIGGFGFDSTVTVGGSVASLVTNTVDGGAGVVVGWGLDGSDGGTTTFTVAKVTSNSTNDLTIAAPLSGGSFIKAGAGTLVLSGGTTFGGTATLSAGTLVLSGVNTFTHGITNNGGTLDLVGDGASTGLLLYSTSITINSPGILNPTGLTNDGSLHVGDINLSQAAQTLTGNGSILSNVVIGASGTLVPGTVTAYGTLTIGSELSVGDTNNGGGAIILNIDHPGEIAVNDSVTAQSIAIFAENGGTPPSLTIDQGTNDLRSGDVFHLFNITGNAGVSTLTNLAVTLPVSSPDSLYAYQWNTNNLAVNGTLILTVGAPALPPPVFGQSVLSGGKLVLSGLGGVPAAEYRILNSTNLTLPLANWTPVWTNVFAANGSYSYTNSAPATNRARFFLLVSP